MTSKVGEKCGLSQLNAPLHRLFGEISKHWAGQPLDSCEIIVDLIGLPF